MPLRSKLTVLHAECEGQWEFIPRLMVVESTAQLAVLGKLYQWRYYRERYGGVPPRFIDTNDSALWPLIHRALISRKGGYVGITPLGKRVYELNYWFREHYLELRREENRKRLEQRRLRYYQGSLTNTDPPRWRED